MKLATIRSQQTTTVCAVTDNGIYLADQRYTGDAGMIHFLEAGDSALQTLLEKTQSATDAVPHDDELKLMAPVPKPAKLFGVALNYRDHITETGIVQPEYPTFFNKQNTSVIGPDAPIHRPRVSEKLDYEGELGIVIGKRCRHVNRQQAHRVIAGYTIVNDVSVRDWQMRSHTWTLGKSFDTHCPCGPWIVTADEIEPHELEIKTRLNGELRQRFNTKDMIFDCYRLLEYLSTVMTLEPGDIIASGTGAGVGVKMKPRGYMRAGDTVTVEIENIGILQNPVIEEPDSTCFIE